MKKARVTLLLCVLALVGYLSVFEPQGLREWLHSMLGQELVRQIGQLANPGSRMPPQYAAQDAATEPARVISANRLYREMQADNQLVPDTRFTRAVEVLNYLVTGEASAGSSQTWNDAEWEIASDGETVGTLPAYPDYLAASRLLEARIRQLSAQSVLNSSGAQADPGYRVKAGIDNFNPRLLTANLAKINGQWQAGNRDGKQLHEAAVNLARLALISIDSLGFSDDVFARALATVALAKAVNTGIDYAETESQLAFAMQYEANARALAEKLPDSSIWRIFVLREDSKLVAALRDNRGRGESNYYLLRRLASEGLSREWYRQVNRAYAGEHAPFHALMTGYRLGDTGVFRYLSRVIPLVVVEYAGGRPVWKRMSDQLVPLLPEAYSETVDQVSRLLLELLQPGIDDTYRQFNENLDKYEPEFHGPFLDAQSWRRLQQSFFTTSIYKHGSYLVDTLEDKELSARLARELNQVDSADAELLGAYFGMLARSIDNRLETGEVVAMMKRVEVLGPQPMFRLFREIRNNFSFGSPQVKDLFDSILAVLDSRIGDRYDYANTIHKNLLNLRAANTAFETIVRDSPESSASVDIWLARYFGRHDEIVRLMHEERRSHRDLIRMLRILKPELIDELGADRLLAPLVAKFPSSWRLRRYYIDSLERAGRYADMRHQADEWTRLAGKRAHRMIRLRSSVIAARSYRLEGNYREALEVLQQTLVDGYGWGYYEATEIAIAQGQYSRAVEIAERVRADFPRSRNSMENLLRAYWHNGDYADAASLVEAGQPYGDDTWRWTLGKIFADVYAGDSVAGLEAFEALLDVDIEHLKLSHLTLMAHKSGNYRLAFEASDKLRYPGAGILVFKLDAYRSLKSWQGEEKALAWFRGQVPASWVNRSSEMIMNSGYYELLWEFIEHPEAGDHPYGVWLIRAAAHVMDGKRDSRRTARLAEYYASPEHATYYDNLGRIALNVESGEDMLERELDLLKVGEVAYYKGIQEFGKGNYYGAADWFNVAVETGVARNAEYKWAHSLLDTWMRRATDLGLQLGTAAKNPAAAG